MRPELFTIDRDAAPGRLSTMARPRGGPWLEDELTALARDGADRLVCLLTDQELVELDLTREPELAAGVGLDLRRLPGAGPGTAGARCDDRAGPRARRRTCSPTGPW